MPGAVRGGGGAGGAAIAPFWLLVLLAAPGQVATGAFLPGLPATAQAFGVAVRVAQLAVTAYVAAFAIGQVPAGWLADRVGRRVVAVGGGVVFAGGAWAAVAAGSLGWLVGARVVEGMGAGALLVAGRAVMRDQAEGGALARSLAGVSAAVWVLGGVSAVVGGYLVRAWSWRGALVPVGVLGVVIMVASLRLPLGWPRGERRGYGVVLRSRLFWRHAGVAAAMVGAFYAFLTGAPAVLEGELGMAPVLLGVVQLGAVGVFAAVAFGARRLRRPGAIGFGLGVAACVELLALPGVGLSVAGVLGGLGLLAASAGLVMPAALAGAVDPFPEQAGAANGAANLLQTVGAGVASLLVSVPGRPELVVPGAMLACVLVALGLEVVGGLAGRGRDAAL